MTALTEDQIQKQIISWAKHYKHNGQKIVSYMHHSPGGGKRASKIGANGKRYSPEAAKFKAMGTLAGFPDLFIFIPKGGFNGLFIELKTKTGKVSENQELMIERLNEQGYRAVVCYGFDESIKTIKDYLETWV